MKDFYQNPPILKDIFSKNKTLQLLIKSLLRGSKSQAETFLKDMKQWSTRIEEEIEPLNLQALQELPEHVPYSAWGQRIDNIKVSKSWQQFKNISAEEALIAVAYDQPFKEFSRVYQFAKLFLFHPSSAFYTCPLAMTDGAIKCLTPLSKDPLVLEAIKKFKSKNPKEFATCGQWMTEREGGSDVGRSSTEARLENKNYHLYGSKWFTSDVVSDYAATLARTDNKEGSGGLSLFFMKVKDDQDRWNQIQVRRLKDKLGTRVLPTAELDLLGTPATLIGEKYKGVKNISNLLNITRLYNTVCALAQPQRVYDLAHDYASRRESFGQKIMDHDLHIETLSNIQSRLAGGLSFIFHNAVLLGRTETKPTKEDELLLRLLIPLGKIVTGKMSLQLTSESMECIGGAAYIEDTGFPVHLRDSQVFSLWEGTSNILSLDVLRVLAKHPEVISVYEDDILKRLSNLKDSPLKEKVKTSLDQIKMFLSKTKDPNALQASARELAWSLFYTYASSLMLDHQDWAEKNKEEWFSVLVNKFCSHDLFFCTEKSADDLKTVKKSVF